MTTPQFTAKEWNISGATRFYRTIDRAYLVEVVTTEDIKGDLLQQAVDKALVRLPYYSMTFVRKKNLFYYADNDLPFEVAESKEARALGGEDVNYHEVDVTYYGKLIRFAMNHALCDGLGLNRFIEAVLYHYFCLKDGKTYNDEGIYTDKIPFDEAELVDVYENQPKMSTKDLKKLADGQVRYRLPELDSAENVAPLSHRLPLKIKTQDLLAWCKACGASPASAISAMTMKAISQKNEVREGVIMCLIPCSLRKYFNAEKTFKNCSLAYFASAQPKDVQTLSTGELAVQLRQTMKAQQTEEHAKLLLGSIATLMKLGRRIPLYSLKKKIMSLGEKPQDTFMVDYVGGLTTNDYTDQIDEVRYLNPDIYRGTFAVLMSETVGYFHVNVNQTFESNCYYEALCSVLEQESIPYERLPRDTYLNPENIIPKK